MHTYKLQYYKGRGLGEAARYMFALADQDYIDERLDHDGDWQKVKPSTIWGTLPQLTIDDDQFICQAQTICKVLGKHFDLIGQNLKEEIYIDMLMGCMDDIAAPLVTIFEEKDQAKKEELNKAFVEKQKDKFHKLEGFLCSNNGGNGWFVGQSVSVADCYLRTKLDWVYFMIPNFLDDFPKLSAFLKRFDSHKKIAAWIAKRPKTEF